MFKQFYVFFNNRVIYKFRLTFCEGEFENSEEIKKATLEASKLGTIKAGLPVASAANNKLQFRDEEKNADIECIKPANKSTISE